NARLLCHEAGMGEGQLALKLRLLRLDAGGSERAVVYLPGFGRGALEPQPDGSVPDLWAVYDYRYKGCVWGRGERWEPGTVPEPPTLLSWLRAQGVTFADDVAGRPRPGAGLAQGGGDSLLARYACH